MRDHLPGRVAVAVPVHAVVMAALCMFVLVMHVTVGEARVGVNGYTSTLPTWESTYIHFESAWYIRMSANPCNRPEKGLCSVHRRIPSTGLQIPGAQ